MWLYESHQQEQDLQLLPRVFSSCCGALPTETGLEPRQLNQSTKSLSHGLHKLPPTALCRTKWLCVFHGCCKWWLLHPKMHKWQLPIPRVRCRPEQVGVTASLETLSAFWPSTGAFFMPLFPIRLTTPALPLPPSLLDPSLFHLLRSPLCQIKKVFHVYWAL